MTDKDGSNRQGDLPTQLAARLEVDSEGSRELDWQLIKALFGFSMWKSKHGYWNLDWPAEWPFSERPLHCSIPGRSPDDVYDSETGKKLPPEEEPTDWLDTIECPAFTASLDDALALAEWALPGKGWECLYSGLMNWRAFTPAGLQRLPLLVCAAILKATTASAVGTERSEVNQEILEEKPE